MPQLRTRLKPADNCGAKSLEVVHIYVGFRHKKAKIGDTVLAVVKEALPNSLVKKKEKVKAVIVRTKKEIGRPDGSYIRFSDNAAVIIDERHDPKGTRIFGPVARELREHHYMKIVSLAPEVL